MKNGFLFILAVIFILSSCNKEENINHLPELPECIEPSDLSDDVPTNTILTWSFSDDKDGDAVKYSVFLDKEPNPTTLVSENQLAASFKASLEMNSTYYWKIIATDSKGNKVETAIWSFSTGQYSWNDDGVTGVFMDSRDGKEYSIVKIGSQVWMAENLAFLPSVNFPHNGSEDSGFENVAFYYVYNYASDNLEMAKLAENYQEYGVLYNWTAASTSAPEGWHLASNDEWESLALYVSNAVGPFEKDYGGNWSGVDKYLKSTTVWNDGNSMDPYGFSALPGGYRIDDNTYNNLGDYATWWTSTEGSPEFEGYYRSIVKDLRILPVYLGVGEASKSIARSARCVMD